LGVGVAVGCAYNSGVTKHAFLPGAGSSRFVISLLSLAVLAAACQSKSSNSSASANAWAVVNGHAITQDDVDKAYRRADRNAQPAAPEDAFATKLGLLDDMMTREAILSKAQELKVEVPDAELDKAYADARKDIPEETFKQELAKRSLTTADVREDLRKDLVVQKLLTREVSSKVVVSDAEIAAFFDANKSQFNRTEEAYRVLQIVVSPGREAQVANRTGSDAVSALEMVTKIRMIMDKLKGGAQFSDVAADYSEDAQTAPRGGDLGFIPVSVIQKYPASLRDAVLNAKPGSAKAIGDGNGFVVVLVAGKDPVGQKELTTPGVKEAISQTLKSQRERLLRASYLTVIRNSAKIDNVISRRIVEAQGKMPVLGIAAGK
jgi:peptidyl-prolyl cis-trans isomerase SurA